LGDARIEKIIHLTEVFTTGNILELGAKERSIKQHFCDLSYKTADIEPGCDLTFDCNKDFPIEEATYDTVIAGDIIEHVKQPSRFIEEVHRILCPGGVLILSTPNVMRNWQAYMRDDHISLLSCDEVLYLMRKKKFIIAHVTGSSVGFTTGRLGWAPGLHWLSKKLGDLFPMLSYYTIAVGIKP